MRLKTFAYVFLVSSFLFGAPALFAQQSCADCIKAGKADPAGNTSSSYTCWWSDVGRFGSCVGGEVACTNTTTASYCTVYPDDGSGGGSGGAGGSGSGGSCAIGAGPTGSCPLQCVACSGGIGGTQLN